MSCFLTIRFAKDFIDRPCGDMQVQIIDAELGCFISPCSRAEHKKQWGAVPIAQYGDWVGSTGRASISGFSRQHDHPPKLSVARGKLLTLTGIDG